jgi:F-type H+-transporting ATPase subunit gamma
MSVASVRDIGEQPTVEQLIGAVKHMLDAYIKGSVDKLYLVSNDFVNTMTQAPTVQQLLPLEADTQEQYSHHWDYIYEPDARELLDSLLGPDISRRSVYQAVVENGACEQGRSNDRL